MSCLIADRRTDEIADQFGIDVARIVEVSTLFNVERSLSYLGMYRQHFTGWPSAQGRATADSSFKVETGTTSQVGRVSRPVTQLMRITDFVSQSKLHNLESIRRSPPVGWGMKRVQAYFIWAKKVTDSEFLPSKWPNTFRFLREFDKLKR